MRFNYITNISCASIFFSVSFLQMGKYKYIVCDEDGPIRVFHSKGEANKFLQEGWYIQVVRVAKKVVDFSQFEEALF